MASLKEVVVKETATGNETLLPESTAKQLDKDRFDILGEGKLVKENGINVVKLTDAAQEKADAKAARLQAEAQEADVPAEDAPKTRSRKAKSTEEAQPDAEGAGQE